MNNIVSYAKEHMESFDVRPLNRVDSLILSELSYFQLPKEPEAGEACALRNCSGRSALSRCLTAYGMEKAAGSS